MKTCLDTALLFNSLGMVPVLIYEGQKRPIGEAWQNQRYTDDELRERFTNNPKLNVGLLLGPDIRGHRPRMRWPGLAPMIWPSYSTARFR